jgi:DedD protein
MGLLSIFKRKTDASVRASEPPPMPGNVQQARARARHRLVGATVLLVIGIIGFPLLFESRPRPIPVDIPIEIPRRDGAPTLVMPSARPAEPSGTASKAAGAVAAGRDGPVASAAAPVAGPATGIVTPAAPAAAVPAPAVTADSAKPAKPAPSPATGTEKVEATKPAAAAPRAAPSAAVTTGPTTAAAATAPTTTPAPAQPTTSATEAARARALLEAKPQQMAKAGGAFVVQFGAFAEPAAAQSARAKVEALGLKTFTQTTDTADGKRIRVRAGPYATREEAERVLIRAKAAGINAAVLTP